MAGGQTQRPPPLREYRLRRRPAAQARRLYSTLGQQQTPPVPSGLSAGRGKRAAPPRRPPFAEKHGRRVAPGDQGEDDGGLPKKHEEKRWAPSGGRRVPNSSASGCNGVMRELTRPTTIADGLYSPHKCRR